MSGHSKFGGSIADRWLNCPGSVALCASVPELPESSYAAEGTLAHLMGSICLKEGLTNAKDAPPIVFEADASVRVTIPDDMPGAVQVYLDAVYAEMAKSPEAELYVETTFAFAGAGDGEEVYGSNDAVVYHPTLGRLVVFDYKHGVGVSVSAEDNKQLKFYAAGAYLANPQWKVREVELVIVQPRARDVEEVGAVKPWPMQTIDLINFADEVREGVERAKKIANILDASGPGWKIEGSLVAGSWCRWCDAAAVCPAREAQALAAATLTYSTINVEPQELPPPQNLDTVRIAEIIKGIEVISAWANQVREFAEAHMLAGTMDIPGWKVVEKIGRRKWTASDSAVVAYADLMFGLPQDDVAPRKLVTLTEIEKQLKASGATRDEIDTFMLRFTIKESSGLTLAQESDRRPAVNAAERAYSDVKLED